MNHKLRKNLDKIRLSIATSGDFQLDYFDFHRNRYYYLLKLIDDLAAGRKISILDLGANPYHLSVCLKNLGHDVVAVNYDYGLIEKEAEKTGLIIKTADLSQGKIPVSDGCFDLVLFSETLEHFNFQPVTILKEIHRNLRPKGKVIITTPNIARLNNRLKLFFGKNIHQSVADTPIIAIHHREYTGEELIQLLERANFKTTLLRYVDFNYTGGNFYLGLVNKFLGFFIKSLRPNLVMVAEK